MVDCLSNKFIILAYNWQVQVPQQSIYRYLLQLLGMGVLLAILCFPKPDLAYDTGLDAPLGWVFNHLFCADLKLEATVYFPHGPLAFLTYPSYETIYGWLLFSFLLLLLLFDNVYRLNKTRGQRYIWPVSFLFVYLACQLMGMHALLLLNLLLACIHHREQGRKLYVVLAILLTGLCFYVKAYFAVLASGIFGTYLLLYLWESKQWKHLLLYGLACLVWIFLLWCLLFGQADGFITYCFGALQLVADNSAAAALYPANNWYLLCLALLGIVFCLFAERKMRWYGSLVLLSLYAAWKHGMSREDVFHVSGMYRYLVLVVVLCWMYAGKPSWRGLLGGVLSLLCFSWNAQQLPAYETPTLDFSSPSYAWNMLLHGNLIITTAQTNSERNFDRNRLSDPVRTTIGQASADAYPWDLSLMPANHLHWQPRPVLQSYAAYTAWLDEQDAHHFASSKSPDYLLWEINKGTQTDTTQNTEGIDGRYLLNDEPMTLLEILQRYAPWQREHHIAIYRKRSQPLQLQHKAGGTVQSTWNSWIVVPHYQGHGIDRVKVQFSASLLERLKAGLYKDEAFYILYRLQDGEVIRHKIVPRNAAEGLWLQPFVRNMAGHWNEPALSAIQFQCSNRNLPGAIIDLQWEHLEWASPEPVVQQFFFMDERQSEDRIFFNSADQVSVFWNKDREPKTMKAAFSGDKAYTVDTSRFSINFKYPLKEFCRQGGVFVVANCWTKAACGSEGLFVIGVQKEETQLFWKATKVEEQVLSPGTWSVIRNTAWLKLNPEDTTAILNVHLWNTGKVPLSLDDIYIKLHSPGP